MRRDRPPTAQRRRAHATDGPSTRRETLLDATAALVVEHGADHVSTSMIAARAGGAVGTLYRYYRDRHAVLDALRQRHRGRFASAMLDALRTAPPHDSRELATTIVDAVVRHHARHPDLHVVGDSLASELDEDGRIVAAIPFAVSSARLEQAVATAEALVRIGSPTPGSPPDAALVRCALHAVGELVRTPAPRRAAVRKGEASSIVDLPIDAAPDGGSMLDRPATVMLVGTLPDGLHLRMVSLAEDSPDVRLVGHADDLTTLRRIAMPPARVTVVGGGPVALSLSAFSAAQGSKLLLLPDAPDSLRPLVEAGLATALPSCRTSTLHTAIRTVCAAAPRPSIAAPAGLDAFEQRLIRTAAAAPTMQDVADALGIGATEAATCLATVREKYARVDRRADSRALLAMRAYEDGLL